MATITPVPIASTNVDAILSDLATGSILERIVCMGAVESTQNFNPALIPHSKVICPAEFSLVTTTTLTGCCGGLPSLVDGMIACCPCGAFCTGSARAMVRWSEGSTGLVFSDYTMTTGSMVDGEPGSGFATDGMSASPTNLIVSRTLRGSAQPTSTSGAGNIASTSSGVLLAQFLLLALLGRMI